MTSVADGTWLEIAGNGAVTTVLAAVVAWIVGRVGRGREDRSAWRDTRQEAYKIVLQDADAACRRLNAIAADLTYGVPDRGTFGVAGRGKVAAELQQVEPLVNKILEQEANIRLIGHGAVY